MRAKIWEQGREMGRYKYNVNRYIFLDLVSSTAKKCTIRLAQLLYSVPIQKKKKKKTSFTQLSVLKQKVE